MSSSWSAHSRSLRRGLCASALCHRCRRLRSPLPRSAANHCAGACSSRFARVAAGVAHRLGGCIDTHITALSGDGPRAGSRWFYRQRIEASLTRESRPWFLLLDAGTHAPFVGTPGRCQIEQIPCRLPALRTTVTGIRTPAQERADDPAGREASVCRRRGMDQETARRTDSRR